MSVYTKFFQGKKIFPMENFLSIYAKFFQGKKIFPMETFFVYITKFFHDKNSKYIWHGLTESDRRQAWKTVRWGQPLHFIKNHRHFVAKFNIKLKGQAAGFEIR